MSTLKHHTEKLHALCPGTVADRDQSRFMAGTAGQHSRALKQMIDGLESYCEAHKATWGPVGEDNFCGPYVRSIAMALIGLLSGPGKFDGGTLWAAIAEIAESSNLSIE